MHITNSVPQHFSSFTSGGEMNPPHTSTGANAHRMGSSAHAGSGRDMAYYDAHWRNDPAPIDGTLLSRIKGHIRQAYERVKKARANLHQKLSDYGKNVMNKLFGAKNGELPPEKLAAIDRRFAATENKLKKMIDNQGADIRFFGPSQFGEETPFEGVTTRNGDRSGLPEIGVSRAVAQFSTNESVQQVLIHEASHNAAGTRDHWYLNNSHTSLAHRSSDMTIRKSVDGEHPVTFKNQVNNADTIAMAAIRLSDPKAVATDSPSLPASTEPSAAFPSRSARRVSAAAPEPVATDRLPGPVRDLDGFRAFIKTRPTTEQFAARYPDVRLVPFGEGFARETGNDQYVAKINEDRRIEFGYFANKV